MEEQILQKYIFPKNRDTIFESCDFHLSEEDSEEKDVYSSSIPTTLKELSVSKKDPHLVLFYFNREEDILEEWEKLGTELPGNNIKLDKNAVAPAKIGAVARISVDFSSLLSDGLIVATRFIAAETLSKALL